MAHSPAPGGEYLTRFSAFSMRICMEKNAAYQTILHKEQKKHLITIHQVTKVLFHNNRYRTTKSGIGNSSN
jgi:hypothetical protein